MSQGPYSNEEWEEVKDKTSVHERFLWVITGEYPSIEELRARTPEEVEEIQREVSQPLRERIENALARLTNRNQYDDLDEILAELEPKEGECLHPEQEEVIEEIFIYGGSALDPFEVKDAKVFKCKSCPGILVMMRDAMGWEIAKAKELLERGGPYYGNEVRFLWQTTGLNLSGFAGIMSLSSDITKNREQLLSWQNFRVPEEFEEHFVRNVRYWLEREEVWNNHLKQKYSDKAGN